MREEYEVEALAEVVVAAGEGVEGEGEEVALEGEGAGAEVVVEAEMGVGSPRKTVHQILMYYLLREWNCPTLRHWEAWWRQDLAL